MCENQLENWINWKTTTLYLYLFVSFQGSQMSKKYNSYKLVLHLYNVWINMDYEFGLSGMYNNILL